MIVLFAINEISAQIKTQTIDSKKVNEHIKLNKKSDIYTVVMPKLDIQKLLLEDEQEKDKDIPYRFGHVFEVDYNMQNSGEWIDVNGGRIWTLKIVSKKAFSINLAYNKFYLPKGSSLYIYNDNKTVLQGPYTYEGNIKGSWFSSDLVEGDAIILEYFEPNNVEELASISISEIVHAYRNLFRKSSKNYGDSDNCNIDINCPQGANWQDESNAVAMILVGSNRICSGCMVNNTSQDYTPYLLTANHCLTNQNVNNWTFRFQYKSPSCGGGDDYSYYSYTGATLRANSSISDYALVELDDRPNGETGITYAGWSRSNIAANSSVGIHHPNGDVMKISIENNTATSTSWLNGMNNTHWRVNFDNGVVEHGSSGSPLFNQNHRIVGQLHGNQNYNDNLSYCRQPIGEYGRFDVSWTNGLS